MQKALESSYGSEWRRHWDNCREEYYPNPCHSPWSDEKAECLIANAQKTENAYYQAEITLRIRGQQPEQC